MYTLIVVMSQIIMYDCIRVQFLVWKYIPHLVSTILGGTYYQLISPCVAMVINII